MSRPGKARGKCNTMRRTERSTHTAIFTNCSRTVHTWAAPRPVVRPTVWQRLEQDVGRDGEQQPELIGSEARATGPVHGQALLQFFQPVLHVAAPS